ncbi:DNA-directed RNA polymerase III subunit rpc3 [Penicillium taxi]|uniref:DNA-directed RNA polymerase III subunit rpc3 n=1 Tax=Penicillium taxi TaxID=168475 RepID=UPI00254563A5|nr:DNA-directed RNA polymerase III subunit rpc3 [Penicillium taxi]KAJ5908012.1 DNA-directed RNA polymerase III subunit rpc3 [Penicillium taxi]
MTSQNAAELCALLIEDNFGELFARIFTTLQRYERLPFPRLKFLSGLSDRQLQNGLVAMIQHHLVYHFTSLEDGNTYYEANSQTAYYLLRSGKILNIVEQRLGKYATKVVQAILYLGHASVVHLETIPELRHLPATLNEDVDTNEAENENGEENGVENGVENGEENGEEPVPELKTAPLNATIKALASHGYLMRLREAHFQSPQDNWLSARKQVSSRPDVKAMRGKRLEDTILDGTKEIIADKTRSDLSGRPMANMNGNHDMEDEDEEENEWDDDEGIPFDPETVVQVNYAKFDVALRTSRFASLAEGEAPPATIEVYKCLLRRVEFLTSSCRTDGEGIPREGEENDQFSIPIELSKIVADVDPELDLSSCLGPLDPDQPLHDKRAANGTKKEATHDIYKGGFTASNVTVNETSSDDDGPSRAWEVSQHLKLIEAPPYNLARQVDISGAIKWVIEFRGLARQLRHLEIERMIDARYGDVATRVVRVLHSKGRLDEKLLQEISLLPLKDMRQTLASLQAGGFVDLQEVPKDGQRQPTKTVFLWYYDPDRICSSVLEDIYKAMARTMQRIKFERERIKDFLDKTERTDVKGHEHEFLTEDELETLQQWTDREALLLTEISRLDDMVAVFRDF